MNKIDKNIDQIFSKVQEMNGKSSDIKTRKINQNGLEIGILFLQSVSSDDKISDILKAHDVATNHVTIGKYIKYLCTAFVFYDIKRYDIRGKKYLETSDKFYMCDTGMRYAILGSRNMDYGRVYENIVCVELLRRGYSPLLQIRDAFPKMIIARTKHPKYTYEGIEVCDIVEWLLDES